MVVHPADVILFEGILVLYNKEIRKLLDMKIFVDTDSDTRLARRGKEKFLNVHQGLFTKCNFAEISKQMLRYLKAGNVSF